MQQKSPSKRYHFVSLCAPCYHKCHRQYTMSSGCYSPRQSNHCFSICRFPGRRNLRVICKRTGIGPRCRLMEDHRPVHHAKTPTIVVFDNRTATTTLHPHEERVADRRASERRARCGVERGRPVGRWMGGLVAKYATVGWMVGAVGAAAGGWVSPVGTCESPSRATSGPTLPPGDIVRAKPLPICYWDW